jgi:hypothetical protein
LIFAKGSAEGLAKIRFKKNLKNKLDRSGVEAGYVVVWVQHKPASMRLLSRILGVIQGSLIPCLEENFGPWYFPNAALESSEERNQARN